MTLTATGLCTFLLTGFAAAVLTGNNDSGDNIVRRHLLEAGTECVTYLGIYMFNEDNDAEEWFCEFSDEDVRRYGVLPKVGIDGAAQEKMSEMGAISGATLLRLGSSSYIENNRSNIFSGRTSTKLKHKHTLFSSVLHLSLEEGFDIENMDEDIDLRHFRNRRRLRTTGKFETLVVRIVDEDGNEPGPSIRDLEETIFEDEVCLKSQLDKCSYGSINIEPSKLASTRVGSKTIDGVIEVEVDLDSNGMEVNDVWDAVLWILLDEFSDGANFSVLNEKFDLIMYCFPYGTTSFESTNWNAFAVLNGIQTAYNNEMCKSVSAQMHEFGHTLGLQHSGEGNDQYEDKTGAMGYSYIENDAPEFCYNAAKSFQLGWYPDQMDSVDPLAIPGGSEEFTLNGVVDYGKSDGYVTLRLDYTGNEENGEDYYIGYNRAAAFNEGTQKYKNKVILTKKENAQEREDRNGPGQSYIITALDENDEYEWRIDGTKITLTVNEISGRNAFITLTGGVGPPPTQRPTRSLTRRPTRRQTRRPTRRPSQRPTIRRQSPPTIEPVPTEVPAQTEKPVSSTSAPQPTPTKNPVSPTSAPVVCDEDRSESFFYQGEMIICYDVGFYTINEVEDFCEGDTEKDDLIGINKCPITCGIFGFGPCLNGAVLI